MRQLVMDLISALHCIVNYEIGRVDPMKLCCSANQFMGQLFIEEYLKLVWFWKVLVETLGLFVWYQSYQSLDRRRG